MAYPLPELVYGYGLLTPYMDARTLELHHLGHHHYYLSRLNALVERFPALAKRPLKETVADIRRVPEQIRQDFRNLAGAHLNHSLLWRVIGPPKDQGPGGGLLTALAARFKGYDCFRDAFEQAALDRFGSGWAWLCLDHHGVLEIATTPNEDSPIMLGLTPILGLDMWEHAYYLQYHRRRDAYVRAWWHVVDWDQVDQLYHLRRESVTHNN